MTDKEIYKITLSNIETLIRLSVAYQEPDLHKAAQLYSDNLTVLGQMLKPEYYNMLLEITGYKEFLRNKN